MPTVCPPPQILVTILIVEKMQFRDKKYVEINKKGHYILKALII